MKKRIALALVLLVAVAAAAVWGIGRYQQHRHERPVFGALTFGPELRTVAEYRLGRFIVRWSPEQGGRLRIRHADDPERVLWETVPGTAFAGAAIGNARIRESRGSFDIRDRLEHVCADQHLGRISKDSSGLTLTGSLLHPGGGEMVDYILTFSEHSANQLAFSLRVAHPRYNRTFLTYATSLDEGFFGFGEQFTYFNLKGRRLPLFVMEQGIGRGAQPITFFANLLANSGGDWWTSYAVAPQYITSKLRALFLESHAYSVFDLRDPWRAQIRLHAPHLAGRILHGATPAALIEEYTRYAGRMRPLPDWILEGAVAGMQGGSGQVRGVWEALRERGTPLAAFWLQDWVGQRKTMFGKQLWWNWELDEAHYPDWHALVDELDAAGVRVMSYVNPFLADLSGLREARRDLFAEARDAGYLVRDASGAPIMIPNTDFSAAMLDLTHPEAWEWFKAVMRDQVLTAGVSGWMADFGEALPVEAKLHGGQDAAVFHNAYPEEWARLNREVIEETGRGDEFVFFTRAGYTRSPEYSTLFWLGDQLVSWDRFDGIKSAVTGLLSSGISGYAFNHSDIGGYTTISSPIRNYHRDRELYLRWLELNAFSVVFRTHEGNDPASNIQFYTDDETLAAFDRFARVYAAWAFYRKELSAEAARTGMPVVRHPFLHYPEDVRFHDMDYQQFLVGDVFLVAPVLDPGKDSVTVLFPPGDWVHVWSGTVHHGGDAGSEAEAPAPLGMPAIFYRSDAPEGPVFQENLRAHGVLGE